MYYNLQAIILKREAFREDDLLVTVYSKEKGKLKLQARGGKKIKSKLAGHLEPVSLSYLEVARGKNIDQLIGAQMAESFSRIKQNVVKWGYAEYLLELAERLTLEGHKDEKVFTLLNKALEYLDGKLETRNWKLETGNSQSSNLAGGRFSNFKNLPVTSYQLPVARISFGFKLLDILGLNPVEKNRGELRGLINFMVKNKLEQILASEDIKRNLKKLNEISAEELQEHLEGKLRSEEFLEKILVNSKL